MFNLKWRAVAALFVSAAFAGGFLYLQVLGARIDAATLRAERAEQKSDAYRDAAEKIRRQAEALEVSRERAFAAHDEAMARISGAAGECLETALPLGLLDK
jgi:uncharacterized protein YhaN